ncbi:NAD-dependent epimerase/dehydratase family protein [Micromonospora sp. CPCC 206060]|uniref:NAD-dependent epimerase/dehydratase family protein n=1 Tax=Micromonospora sp. CPCC 206060 TaxID=3122406 RepID=UPI002FF1B4D8
MRILVLGGTRFLGRAVARLAHDRGYDVTCAARSVSGAPPAGPRFVPVDRDDPDGLAALDGAWFDAVVDVTRRVDHARYALDTLADRVGHWVFVSSISVYADHSVPGRSVADSPLLPPAPDGVDGPGPDFRWYGECKVSIERAVLDRVGADRSFICRAGLIVGPEDTSDRFPYWVRRLADGGEVLAPGRPDEPVQWVDVEDLAGWLLHAATTRLAGTFDGTGPARGLAEVLAGIAAGVDRPDPRLTWVDGDFLRARDVRPWSGERSLPLWVGGDPADAGFLARDVTDALAAGLTVRPVAASAQATLDWMTNAPEAVRPGGLGRAVEAEVLREWHAERDG